MRFLLLIFFIIPSLSVAQANRSGTETRDIDLYVGLPHDETLPRLPGSFDLSGTYRSVTRIETRRGQSQLRFVPTKEGIGTVIIKDKNTGQIVYQLTVRVGKTDLQRVAREIRSLLSTIEGVTVRVLNNRVVVDGQILLPSDMKRIHSVVKQYGPLATTLVTLSPIAQNKIAEIIERDINNPEIYVRAVNGKFILDGMANSPEERDRAEIIAKMYVPDVVVEEAVADKRVLERRTDVVINLIKIKQAAAPEPEKIIQMVIHFVELQKDYTRGFRFQWTPDIGDGSTLQFSTGGRSPGGLVGTLTGTISNLLPKLNWAKQHGFARVLQSSSLIVQDGRQGTLNSLTRVPYQVISATGQPGTNFEEVGLRTNITPQVMGARSDSVRLDMNFSVKNLLSYTDQGPLTSSREINTMIHVRSGQSAAVGGLISSDTGTNYNKLPSNASQNPIFSLYASRDFRNNQSQFVVFVTPSIRASASQGSDRIKQKFRLPD